MIDLRDAAKAFGEGILSGIAITCALLRRGADVDRRYFAAPVLFRTLMGLAFGIVTYGLSFAVVSGNRPYLIHRLEFGGAEIRGSFSHRVLAAYMVGLLLSIDAAFTGIKFDLQDTIYITVVMFIFHQANDGHLDVSGVVKMQILWYFLALAIRLSLCSLGLP